MLNLKKLPIIISSIGILLLLFFVHFENENLNFQQGRLLKKHH